MTKSIGMGIKSTGIILHAAGPVWRHGASGEANSLSVVIQNCIEEAIKHKCDSIAIPAVSCGIFGYPIGQGTEIISKTILDCLKTRYSSANTLRTVLLISNDQAIVDEWVKSLNKVCIESKLNLESAMNTMNNKNNNNNQWYWKDDEEKWKAYKDKYSIFLQTKFEQKKYNFDMQIEGKDYTFVLNIPNEYFSSTFAQVNKVTRFKHQVSNFIPNVNAIRWYWMDDANEKSPYSNEHSEKIEMAFQEKGRKEGTLIELKRYVDDVNCKYLIEFCDRNANASNFAKNTNADGVQTNITTGNLYQRCIFRQEYTKSADIVYEEDELKVNKNLILFITGFRDDVSKVKSDMMQLVKSGYKTVPMPLPDNINMLNLEQLQRDYEVKIDNTDQGINVTGMKDNLELFKEHILNLLVQDSKIAYPDYWSRMNSNRDLEIFKLCQTSKEFKDIYKEISKSVSSFEIEKIERIQNKQLWKRYKNQVKVSLLIKNVKENEHHLFHGTRQTNPNEIYDNVELNDIGFDMRYCSSGMWGRGIYFAVNAKYSKDGYAYKNSNGTHSLFYARVALGECIQLPNNGNLIMPPEKSGSKGRYDSIKGNSNDSDIYIIYENARAYPEYLITFKS